MREQERARRRLWAWNLAVLALAVGLVVGVALLLEARASDAALDKDLREGAERTAARLVHFAHEGDEDDEVTPGEGREVLATARTSDGRTFRSRHARRAGLPDEAALAAALAGRTTRAELISGELTLRVLTIPVHHDHRIIGAVQVARSTGEARRALARTTLALGATGLFGLLLALPLGVFLAGRAMRPITEALERQRRFVADASHELRTPVAVLRARAESIARGEAPGGELDRLRRDAEGLSGLLDDLLDLARLDADQLGLRREPFPVGDIAEELVEELTPLARQRGLRLDARPRPIFARADPARTRQVLRALVDNALAHARSGVQIEVERAGARALIHVRDDGPGIAAADLPRLFDRFYRADQARARGEGGAGLGLAIASELAQRMGGSLCARSEPGQGATFTVALPAAD